MTDAEAGQVLLEGNYWRACTKCLGSGWHDQENQEGQCLDCLGSGFFLRPGVLEARTHLGMNWPNDKPKSGYQINESVKEALQRMRALEETK